jgi:hypothetical protein
MKTTIQDGKCSMTDEQRKRVAELTEFIHSKMIDPDKFHLTVSDCLLLLESQWEEFCAGSERAFQIQREKEILEILSKENG